LTLILSQHFTFFWEPRINFFLSKLNFLPILPSFGLYRQGQPHHSPSVALATPVLRNKIRLHVRTSYFCPTIRLTNQYTYFNKCQASANRGFAFDVNAIERICVSLSVLSRCRVVAQTRRDEIVPSIGILRGRILAPAFTSPTRPKTPLTDFGDFIVSTSKWVMICIYYTLITFCDRTWQVNDHICIVWMSSSFKFTREIFINKFEVPNLQVRPWNLIKHLKIPLCIIISIWSYKFCCGVPKFCKTVKQRVPLTPTYWKQYLHPSPLPRAALQINPPSWCWNILIDRNVNFVVPSRPNLTFKI
jgi:hypothetical protein